MTHGGKRSGAGRPLVLIDEKRIVALRTQGYSFAKIAERFGVAKHLIQYRVDKMRNAPRPD